MTGSNQGPGGPWQQGGWPPSGQAGGWPPGQGPPQQGPPQQGPPQGWGPPQGPPPGWAPQVAPPPQGWQPPQGQWQPGPQPHPGQFAPDQPPMHVGPRGPVRHGENFNVFQREFFRKTFGWMFLGLGITAGVSWVTFTSGLWLAIEPILLPLFLVQLGLVWWLGSRVMKMSTGAAIGSFLAYSALNGLTLSVIFVINSLGLIAMAFGAATMMFGFMFVLGSFTKRDLTGMGTYLMMAVFGLIAASLLNMLAFRFGWFPEGNAVLYSLINYAGVLVFAGLTAYDAQKLKAISAEGFGDEGLEQRVSVLGALTLYLDFINLFLFILRIMGGRRD